MPSAQWKPTASLANLRARALFLQTIRTFFAKRSVWEVDTPLLYKGVATDPNLEAFAVACDVSQQETRYLQTSPEFPMKRLVAAGSGPIYFLGKAFRKEEVGKRHNPEFTMLEWYQPGWDHFQLIEEVDLLLQTLLATKSAKIVTYLTLFEKYFDFNPHIISLETLHAVVAKQPWAGNHFSTELDKDGCLDLLFSHAIEPYLGQIEPTVVIEYPASQASLAKTHSVNEAGGSYWVAERFEFYYQGMELANGYHELACPKEQLARFEEDLATRKMLKAAMLPIDEALIAALMAGFPECAGVAVGIDRLLMIKLQETHIANVIPFAWNRLKGDSF